MSAGIPTGGSNSQDVELNLASIIDCFTVLIAFMLASAGFLSIGILDAGVAAAGAQAASDSKPPSVNVTIELEKDHQLTVKLSGKASGSTPIAAQNGKWNYDELTNQLTSLKSKYPDVAAVTLNANNDTEYKDVVKAMEVTRKTIPVVLLGGF